MPELWVFISGPNDRQWMIPSGWYRRPSCFGVPCLLTPTDLESRYQESSYACTCTHWIPGSLAKICGASSDGQYLSIRSRLVVSGRVVCVETGRYCMVYVLMATSEDSLSTSFVPLSWWNCDRLGCGFDIRVCKSFEAMKDSLMHFRVMRVWDERCVMDKNGATMTEAKRCLDRTEPSLYCWLSGLVALGFSMGLSSL